jgi:hypothetical protein
VLQPKTSARREHQRIAPAHRLAEGSRRKDDVRFIVRAGLEVMSGEPELLQDPAGNLFCKGRLRAWNVGHVKRPKPRMEMFRLDLFFGHAHHPTSHFIHNHAARDRTPRVNMNRLTLAG